MSGDRQVIDEHRRNSDLRDMALRALCRHAGMTQREAFAVLRMRTGVLLILEKAPNMAFEDMAKMFITWFSPIE